MFDCKMCKTMGLISNKKQQLQGFYPECLFWNIYNIAEKISIFLRRTL